MKLIPHKFQDVAIDHAVQTLLAGNDQLYASPTGTGKSVVQAGVLERLLEAWLVTPREEILDGILDKGADPERVWTPIKLRNRMMRGELNPPKYLIFDETHHESAASWQQLQLLCGQAPKVGYTATPYRGSPRGTKEFRDRWGEPLWLIEFQEAAQLGYISVPEFTMLPLVDDDVIELKGAEFEIASLESATFDRLADLAEHARDWWSDGLWDRPTIFACPSSRCCELLRRELESRGMLAMTVNASTPPETRRAVFDAAVNRIAALLHINIVQEGVDLPLRRLIDLAPTMSPVKWVQQLGRITRPLKPGQLPPVYICTNRNLFRHAYALSGAVPSYALAEASAAFPKTERGHSRVLGMECIGRFKPDKVELASGVDCHLYSMSTVVPNVGVVEYFCIMHPASDPIWASKVRVIGESGVTNWGKWATCEAPLDLVGFGSVPPRELTPKQQAWWDRSSAAFGLRKDQKLTKKNFQALPVLVDLGMRLI